MKSNLTRSVLQAEGAHVIRPRSDEHEAGLRAGALRSHAEQLGVPRLDLLALLLHRGGIFPHGLELPEREPTMGFLGLWMQ